MQNVLERFTRHHGPEWHEVISSSEDELKVRNLLVQIISNKVNYQDSEFKDYILWKPHIREMAINELGNFSAVDGSGGTRTFDELKKIHDIYKKSKNKNDKDGLDSYLISIYQSISNIGTPQALEYLSDELGKSLKYDYSLIDTINSNLAGKEHLVQEKTDYDFELDYKPNLERPYYKRAGRWDKVVKDFRLKLAKYRVNKNIPSSLKKHARVANFTTAKTIERKNKYLAMNSNDNFSRSIASKQSIKTDKDSNDLTLSESGDQKDRSLASNSLVEKSYWWYFAITFIVLSILYFIRKRFR